MMEKDPAQYWRIGDTLAMKDANDNFRFGTVKSYAETFGGPGYYLQDDRGREFYGTDNSLFVQCSYGSGGDPANQCDEMISAGGSSAYCPTHRTLVMDLEQHLTKLDALEDNESNGKDPQ